MKKNTASQVVGAQMVSATDGSAFTGSVTVYVTGDGGTQAVGSVGSGACTHEGNGFHTYAPAQAETNYDHVAFTFIGTGAVPTTVQIYTTFPQTGDSYARLGAPAGASVSADLATIDGNVDSILADTGTDGVVLAAGSITAAVVATGAIDADALAADAVAEIADGVWDEATSGHVTAGTYGVAVTDVLADTADIQPKFGTVADLGSGATLAGNLSDMAGATFATSTDSLEAIRNRGDAAWTTGAGGTPPDLLVSTTIATLASQTSFTLTAGSADDDAYNGALVVVTDSATSTQKAVGQVSDYTGSTRTVTLSADPAIFTMAVGDSIAIVAVGQATASVDTAAIADAVWDEALSGHVTAGSAGKAVADIETDATAILADTADMQPKIGTPAGGTLAADLAAIEGEVDSVLTSTTIDGVVVNWAAIVNPTATKSFTNTTIAVTSAVAGNVGGNVVGSVGSVTNRVTANADQIAGSATAATNLSSSAAGLVPSTVNDASATTTSFVTALTEATDDHYNGRIITFTSGALAGQSTDITDYNGTTKAVTVTALTEAPANGVSFVIS